jgi:acetolactate synthase-1/2/3 large subunit
VKGSQYIAKTWLAYGVKDIFLVPTNLFDSLVELEGKGVRRILTHGEKAAGYMADGYAQATGRPGIVITQGGPGATNLAAGLAEPWQSSTPVIAFTGARSHAQSYKNAYQDVTAHFESVTKYDVEVARTDRLPDLLAQAFREATTGDPRPVHLAIHPEAEAGEADLPEPEANPRFVSYPAIRTEPSAPDVEAAVELLLRAERPVIVAGGGLIKSGAWPELIELAERLSIPVATSLSGKGAINENHPLAVGVLGTYARRCANRVVELADVALIVGTRTGSQSTNNWTLPRQNADIIHINIDPRELGRNYPRNTRVGLAADAKVALTRIMEALGENRRAPGEWVAEAQRIVHRWWEGKEPLLSSDASPIRPERLCRELTEALPGDAVIVADTGYAAAWCGAFVELREPGKRFFRCEGSLGWALPAAIGVKAALPDKPVICFTGDGGFWYHLSELETALRYNLNVVFVVLNNHALVFDTHILDFRFDSKAYELAEFTDVDFARVAQAIGCDGIRVHKPDDLPAALRRAFANDKSIVIDVVIDHDAVAPVTSYDRMGRRERMVPDELGEVVTSRGAVSTPA